jgi:hypothetical protein
MHHYVGKNLVTTLSNIHEKNLKTKGLIQQQEPCRCRLGVKNTSEKKNPPAKQHIYPKIYIYICQEFYLSAKQANGNRLPCGGTSSLTPPARGRGDAKNPLYPWGTRDGERGRSQSIKIKVLDPRFRGDDTLRVLGAQKEYPAPPPETSSGDA